MRNALAGASLLLGAVYMTHGVITVIDLKRGWHRLGPSHFGLAWIALAFTCGPHHFEHGLHIAAGERSAGPLELVAVVLGLPAGIIWILLRLEALRGGLGDRIVAADSRGVRLLPPAAAVWTAAFVAGAFRILGDGGGALPTMSPNVLLVVLYGMIGWSLLKGQLANHAMTGLWSLSGLSITLVFPTCALMHAAWVVYQISGAYDMDAHGLIIDWFGVPAAFYFLWVVRGLQRGEMRDWNEAATGVTLEPVTPQ